MIALVCANRNCFTVAEIDAPQPESAVDLAAIAQRIGWHAVYRRTRHGGRVDIYCCGEHVPRQYRAAAQAVEGKR